MSNSVKPLRIAQCYDPITDVKAAGDEEYIVLKGGSRVTYQTITTSSYSNSSVQFTCPPPNPGIIVDRKIKFKLPVRLTFSGTDVGSLLLQNGLDAFRAFPISSVIQTASATINNTAVSINLSDVVHPLLRYNMGRDVLDTDFSVSPSMLDTYQRYADGTGSNRNPLAPYADNTYQVPRGSFPFTVVSMTNTTAVIDADLCEYIMLSPFSFGKWNSPGFYGVQTMQFNFTFGDLSRMWSHSDDAAAAVINSLSVSIQAQPALQFKYITPSLTQELPEACVYPFFNVQRYTTDTSSSVAAGGSVTITSNNIQLQSIPQRIFVFARRRDADQSITTTDTYFGLRGININWNNNSGLLSSASVQDLYEMSVKNGCCMSWQEWNGLTNSVSGATSSVIGTVGSVLCLEMATDVALNPGEAPGSLGNYQLQITATFENVNQVSAITPAMYVIVVSEGSFTVMNNSALSQIGVISQKDVLESDKAPYVSYNELKYAYGGDFLSSLKALGKKIAPWIMKAVPYLKEGVGTVCDIAGYEKKGGAIVGGAPVGGAPVGGAKLSRNALLEKLYG